MKNIKYITKQSLINSGLVEIYKNAFCLNDPLDNEDYEKIENNKSLRKPSIYINLYFDGEKFIEACKDKEIDY